jgi:ubiquinone/menaquinone biosynthesis C-methylase UbiE
MQPDQNPALWNDHVSVYEAVFEPFSLTFAAAAIDALHLRSGQSVIDVGAGSGGAALALAHLGYPVTAIDAAPAMVERIRERASVAGVEIAARVMDAATLALPDATFDAALSVFGIILLPDAVRGLAEMRRVVRPGGRVAIVTWTEPQEYELAVALRAALVQVRPDPPSTPLPAQLRYRERADCIALFHAAGFDDVHVETHRAELRAPSVRWLAERLRFAPGMAAQLDSAGPDAGRVVQRFVTDTEVRQGQGEVRFAGKAFVATAVVG